MSRSYHLRLTQTGDTFTATIRELAQTNRPEDWVFVDAGAIGTGSNAPAAMVAAIAAARIPQCPKPRRDSRYAC